MHRYVYAALVAVGVPFAANASVVISEVAWSRHQKRFWSRGKMGLLLGVFFWVMPGITHAGVLISEVAWMGSSENANAEWIELYNDGAEQNVTGWTLTATDGQPALSLSGSIAANGYALLERTSDDTVPGVAAFLIYTGAMGNTGEILELRNEIGALVDRVDGSNNWAVGGNNETKETLQRSGTPATGSFITAPPTPKGGGGIPAEEESDDADTDTNTTSSSTGSTSGTVAGTNTSRSTGGNVIYGVQRSSSREYERLEPALTLLVAEERTVTARVPVEYVAHAFRESGKEIRLDSVTWNFGDGTVKKGMTVTHAYAYPGTYVAHVSGERSGFAEGIEDTVRMTVRVVEPNVTIKEATSAYIELTNTSGDEADLSGYVLMHGQSTFTIPVGTIVLQKMSVRFPRTRTGLQGGTGTALYHPTGALLSVHDPIHTSRTASEPRVAPKATDTDASKNLKAQTKPESTTSTSSMVTTALSGTAYAFDAAEAERTNGRPLWWWLLGLGAAILVTSTVIILVRRERESERILGFEIESDE